MITVSDDRFQELIDQALTELPGEHVANIKNIAIIYANEPSEEQREKGLLKPWQTLLGLYEGLPLSRRQGMTKTFPDKITLFKLPLSMHTSTEAELKEAIRHTLWHEIGHYYGLNHDDIAARE